MESGSPAGEGLHLAEMLGRFWAWRGHLSEGRAWLERALAVAPPEPSRWQVNAVLEMSELAYRQGDMRAARFEEALPLARALGDPELISLALNGLGNLVSTAGDYDRAKALYEEQLALDRERGVSGTLGNLGILAASQGDLSRAAALFVESLEISQEIGDTMGTSTALINMGQVALGRRCWQEAAGFLRDGLLQTAEINLLDIGLIEAFMGLGAVAGAMGKPEEAARLFGAAHGLTDRLGVFPDFVLPRVWDRAIAETQGALGEDAYVAAHATGAALSLEEAIAEVLAVDEEMTGDTDGTEAAG